jgi:hypothetical protein
MEALGHVEYLLVNTFLVIFQHILKYFATLVAGVLCQGGACRFRKGPERPQVCRFCIP